MYLTIENLLAIATFQKKKRISTYSFLQLIVELIVIHEFFDEGLLNITCSNVKCIFVLTLKNKGT